ncbi:MAG: type II secretion system protein [Elusimicrobiales bacterium]|nr:type II secretion system protein [Elusimicrobiales bacterium]
MKKGFTLIELLVVVLIIGILSSVALPQYTKAVEKSRWTEAMTNVRKLGDALEVYKLGSNGALPASIDELDISVGTPAADNPLASMAGKFRYTIGGSGDIVGNWHGRTSADKNYLNIIYNANDHYMYCKFQSKTTNSVGWSVCASLSNNCAEKVNPAGTNCSSFFCCKI